MDIIICFSVMLMLALSIFHCAVWAKEKFTITSPHLRSATVLLFCFTVLSVLLFGMRMFVKPDVSIAYQDSSQEIYSNLINSPTTQVVESKKILTCSVVFEKTYPMSVIIGRSVKTSNYKVPCDSLTSDMKSDIAAMVSYLKEDIHNVK